MSTFDDEKRMQPYMDVFYKSVGYTLDRSGSCKAYDLIVTNLTQRYKIEEKYLFNDADYDQGLIEIIQDIKTGDFGWFYHTGCDFLFWIYCHENRELRPRYAYCMRWPKVKQYVLDQLGKSKWSKFNLCSDNYGLTLNYPVNWQALLSLKIASKIDLAPPEPEEEIPF